MVSHNYYDPVSGVVSIHLLHRIRWYMIGAKIILYQFNNTMSNPIEMNREDMYMWHVVDDMDMAAFENQVCLLGLPRYIAYFFWLKIGLKKGRMKKRYSSLLISVYYSEKREYFIWTPKHIYSRRRESSEIWLGNDMRKFLGQVFGGGRGGCISKEMITLSAHLRLLCCL